MSKKIHLTKFANGRETPQEMHRRLAWGGKRCDACKGPPVVRCITYAPFVDLSQRSPELLASLAAKNDGRIPMVEFTHGKYVKVGQAFACAACHKNLQRTAAHGAASYIQHEWDWGPEAANPVSGQVPGMT
jgi:hypothetical protein